MLNRIWLGFFVVATFAALYQWLAGGDAEVFGRMVLSLLDSAKLGFETSIGLIGILTLWLGLLRIAEQAGVVAKLARALSPLLERLMPEVPKNHPAFGNITLNFAANMLGLDNAATPVGLKAMQDLQSLNPNPGTATNAQIMFLVLNASSLTLLPITVFMYRAQFGAADPTSVFIPILLATAASKITGIASVAFMQKLKLGRVVLAYALGLLALVGLLIWYFASLAPTEQASHSALLGHLVLWSIVMLFLFEGWRTRIPVYETFIEGAKEGFNIGVRLIPYLVAMLVAIGVFHASGALDGLLYCIRTLLEHLHLNTEFVDALPTALMKPFSGSGARALMIETMKSHGVDSFPARVSAVIQGSTETTFYVLAVYFGAVGITRARHAVGCALLAELTGVIAAIFVSYWFFSV